MTVTISVKNNVRVKGAAYIPDVENHTGKIIPNPKWLSKDYLCLTTGDLSFPFRIINRANIVGELYAANTVSDTVFTVKSSDKKKTYTVTNSNGQWSCTCVGFGFRRHCKHITEIQNKK